jgi:hypothetical protein
MLKDLENKHENESEQAYCPEESRDSEAMGDQKATRKNGERDKRSSSSDTEAISAALIRACDVTLAVPARVID